MTTTLRPYQLAAVAAIRAHAATKGLGVILQMPTGAGKTAAFSDVLAGAYRKGKTGIMVVRGKALVHQASERLRREGIPHGIYQGDNSHSQHESILLCSVDTLYARKIAPKADIIVIDECHLAHSDGYLWLLAHENYKTTFRLGVSATPHHKKGMRHIADKFIMPIGINELIEQGFLVGGRYFMPYVPDLRGIKKTDGDFNGKDLSRRSSDDGELTANAAKVWDKHLRGKSTLVFAASVEHAGVIARSLESAGARVDTITAQTRDSERKTQIAALERGELDAIVSVGVLTTGVDIPSLRAILCCRPTESYNLWIQILGRGTRQYPGKRDFLVYDLSGNLLKHGPIESEIVGSLDGMPTTPKTPMNLCGECYALFRKELAFCPECETAVTKTCSRKTGTRQHGLGENEEVVEHVVKPWEIELPKLIAIARDKGLKKGWLFHQIKAKFGEAEAEAAWRRVRSLKKWPTKALAPAHMPS